MSDTRSRSKGREAAETYNSREESNKQIPETGSNTMPAIRSGPPPFPLSDLSMPVRDQTATTSCVSSSEGITGSLISLCQKYYDGMLQAAAGYPQAVAIKEHWEVFNIWKDLKDDLDQRLSSNESLRDLTVSTLANLIQIYRPGRNPHC